MTNPTTILRLTRQTFLHDGLPLAVSHATGYTEFPLHCHDFSEFVFVQRGEGVHLVEEMAHPVRGGDVFVIHGALAHGYRELCGMDQINILFTREAVQLTASGRNALPGYHALFAVEPLASSRQTFSSRLHLSLSQQAWLQAAIEHLESELHTRAPGFEDMALSYFQQIVVFTSRAYTRQVTETSDRMLRLGQLISILDQDYAAPWTLAELADAVSMSPRSLTRQCAMLLGESPIAFLLHVRLNKAAELLCTSERAVTDIAASVGFRDSNYFTRQFHREFGMPPIAYRRLYLTPHA